MQLYGNSLVREYFSYTIVVGQVFVLFGWWGQRQVVGLICIHGKKIWGREIKHVIAMFMIFLDPIQWQKKEKDYTLSDEKEMRKREMRVIKL